jgi:hypothetical protein
VHKLLLRDLLRSDHRLGGQLKSLHAIEKSVFFLSRFFFAAFCFASLCLAFLLLPLSTRIYPAYTTPKLVLSD